MTQLCTVRSGIVLAEFGHLLRDERQAIQVFIQDLAGDAFTCVRPSVGELSRAMEVGRRFGDLGLGFVDGSVVALAESLGYQVFGFENDGQKPDWPSTIHSGHGRRSGIGRRWHGRYINERKNCGNLSCRTLGSTIRRPR